MSDETEFSSPSFIEDGHSLVLTWERDVVRVAEVYCPNVGVSSLCNRRRSYCVVNRFISVYGTECNVGKTLLTGPVKVAWIPVLGESDLDAEFSQIWVCPVEDPDFKAMKNDPEGLGYSDTP